MKISKFFDFQKLQKDIVYAFSEHFRNFKQKNQLQTEKFNKLYTMLG